MGLNGFEWAQWPMDSLLLKQVINMMNMLCINNTWHILIRKRGGGEYGNAMTLIGLALNGLGLQSCKQINREIAQI
jgi:hypothetical protein